MLFKQLWVQVLLATVAGIVLGHWWPQLGADMKPLGDAFIALVRMLIAPVPWLPPRPELLAPPSSSGSGSR